MPVIPTNLDRTATYRSAVTLEYYAWLIGYSECAMFGVFNPDSYVDDACRDIWTLDQRNYLLRYFTEAQEELENETKRLFMPTWITGNYYDTGNERLTDLQTYRRGVYYTKWNNVLKLGKKVETVLGENVIVDYTVDPAVIGVTIDPTKTYDINFIKVLYGGTKLEVNPSNIIYAGDKMVISIPRCRIVAYDRRDNPSSGLQYTDITNFAETVDVIYYETVNEDSLVIARSNCTCELSEETECLEFVTRGLNTVRAVEACFTPCLCEQREIYAGLHYLAGEIKPTVQQMDMIIRLAHSKMPDEPCGCDISQRLWKRDRNIPELLTAERLQCPFGINDGAWIAYKWAQSMKKLRIGHA